VAKKRLDKILLERGMLLSRELAQSLIIRGDVLVNNTPVTKPGQATSEDAEIRIRGELPKYVSRGGDKLEGALIDLSIELNGEVVLDVGASTGGFTDCVLQHGASFVYAVDVGKAQLAEKLRQDPRVKSIEELHAKDLKSELFSQPINLAVIDVSFIGLRKVLPYVVRVLTPPFRILALVKPQFELGPEFVEAGGVVSDESLQLEAVAVVADFVKTLDCKVIAQTPSKLKGAKKGNQEYFVLISDVRNPY